MPPVRESPRDTYFSTRYVLRQRGHTVMNYVDDFFGVEMQRDARGAYDTLYAVLQKLGLTISVKKLVPPGTKAVCLGIAFDTEKGEISIPAEKMSKIVHMVEEWQAKKCCTRHQLQSLLGHLLYVHKCVKPARFIVNWILVFLDPTTTKTEYA